MALTRRATATRSTVDGLLKDKTRLAEILCVQPGVFTRSWRADPRPPPPTLLAAIPRCLTRMSLSCRSFHVMKGKTASKWIINGSGQMPTICELPNTKRGGIWKVVMCVDPKANGKNGAPLKVGQNCACPFPSFVCLLHAFPRF